MFLFCNSHVVNCRLDMYNNLVYHIMIILKWIFLVKKALVTPPSQKKKENKEKRAVRSVRKIA